MATVEPSQALDQQPQPLSSSEAMTVDTAINGAAVQHNSMDAFPPSPPHSADLQTDLPRKTIPLPGDMGHTQSIEAPITNVQSGLAPVAPLVEEVKADPVPRLTEDLIAPRTPDIAKISIADQADESSVSIATSVPLVPSSPDAAPASVANAPPAEQAESQSVYAPTISEQQPEHASPTVPNGVPTKVEPASEDTEMLDVQQTSTKVARERDEDEDDEPSAKRARTETIPSTDALDTSTTSAVVPSEMSTPLLMPEPASTPAGEMASGAVAVSAQAVSEDWGPMTDAQSRQLKQNIQNLKKGRHSLNFTKPVDPVALHIPTYLDVIKQPMDLSTLEQNLKDGKYASVNDFSQDFNLIVENSIKFNGLEHLVTVAAQSLRAQFQAGLRKVPKAGEVLSQPQKKQRAPSFNLPSRDTKARGARQSTGLAASPTTATGPTFALGNNGIPLTRRTSNNVDGRPKREIIRPPPRDLPYASAKPKKKKYQMELKFCEHVLAELKKGRYGHLMAPFANPVDPVALNIPNYLKVIKKPMDFGTISEKLQSAQYENAKEFETDVRLVFDNCIKFNTPQHPISLLAKQFDDIFTQEMSHKSTWIAHNAPASAPQSPELESDSDQEEEEDEDDDEQHQKALALEKIQAQIAALSESAMALVSGGVVKGAKTGSKKTTKTAKTGGVKTSNKKATTVSSRPDKKASKSKVKSTKPLTNKEKEEIAERIGELSGEQTARAAEQIKAGLRRIGRHDLADRPDDELEFDISIIPEETLQYIFKMIRTIPNPNDYRTAASVAQSRAAPAPARAKKNKPMGKHEQEAAIRRIQDQMKSFDAPGADDSSPGNDEMSDDDDSGSESEEE